jgi:uncharacterized ion transporter superfamily protein YfcC
MRCPSSASCSWSRASAPGWIAGAGKKVWGALGQGVVGILPAIPLILMAVSVKQIVVQGGVLDTILHWAAAPLSAASPFATALLVYGLALLIEVFVASGSAKAFLMMPILLPLADLLGVTRQVTVLAYCFGDGFSNLMYPTNPVLLICLGLATVSYTRWLKWSLPLVGGGHSRHGIAFLASPSPSVTAHSS